MAVELKKLTPKFQDLNPVSDSALETAAKTLARTLKLKPEKEITASTAEVLTDLEFSLYTNELTVGLVPTWMKFRNTVLLSSIASTIAAGGGVTEDPTEEPDDGTDTGTDGTGGDTGSGNGGSGGSSGGGTGGGTGGTGGGTTEVIGSVGTPFITKLNSTTLTLNWFTPSGNPPFTYQVQQRLTGSSTWTNIAMTSNTFVDVTSLSPLTSYQFEVIPSNANVTSNVTPTIVSATTTAPFKSNALVQSAMTANLTGFIGTVTGVTANIDNGVVTVNWTPLQGSSQVTYKVYVATSASGPFTLASTVTNVNTATFTP